MALIIPAAASRAMTPEQRALAAIETMDAEQKFAIRLFGDHRQSCAKQKGRWGVLSNVYPATVGPPECDCGWLEGLGEACKARGAAVEEQYTPETCPSHLVIVHPVENDPDCPDYCYCETCGWAP